MPPRPTVAPRSTSRAPREAGLGLLFVTFGVGLLPLLVYVAGAATLGPYDGGLGTFLGHYYRALLGLAPGALALALGPYGVFLAVRYLTRPLRRRPD